MPCCFPTKKRKKREKKENAADRNGGTSYRQTQKRKIMLHTDEVRLYTKIRLRDIKRHVHDRSLLDLSILCAEVFHAYNGVHERFARVVTPIS
jgi:hypothetical protein